MGKTGREAHEILLGDTDVEGAVRVLLLETNVPAGPHEIGVHDDDLVALGAQLGDVLARDVADGDHLGEALGLCHPTHPTSR